MIRACPHCAARNRIPARHLAHEGRCGACRQSLPALAAPLDVSAAEFAEIVAQSPVPVLVDFWAAWCGPCQRAAPEVKAAAEALAGRALVLKVDTEAEPALAAQYAVRSIPYFAIFRGGQKVWDQAGLLSRAQLVQRVAAS